MVKTGKPIISEELFFKKPNETHRFVFAAAVVLYNAQTILLAILRTNTSVGVKIH
jgi:predicted GH43/DUF377 family glycosyl hydrolase